MATVAETIKERTRIHLEENNGLLFGQCVTAVGWINGTVPDCKNIAELPMSDGGGGSGIVVGAALAGRRPILVFRFQDFALMNGSPIIHYAAKVKELHDRKCPMMVRLVGSEGLGPVHSGMYHSLFMHFPGMAVFAPCTPGEVNGVFDCFEECDYPVIVSEHRETYNIDSEYSNYTQVENEITVFLISVCRRHAEELFVKTNGKVNIIHIRRLKPLNLVEIIPYMAGNVRCGVVVDPGHEICGASEHIAIRIHQATGKRMYAMGTYNLTKCLYGFYKNSYPSLNRILNFVQEIISAIHV